MLHFFNISAAGLRPAEATHTGGIGSASILQISFAFTRDALGPTVSSACSPVGRGRPDSPPFRSDHPHPCEALLPAIPRWRRPDASFTDLPSHRVLLGWSPDPVGIIPFRWSYLITFQRDCQGFLRIFFADPRTSYSGISP